MKKLDKAYRKEGRTYFNFLCGCGNTIILRDDSTAKSCRLPNCTINTKRRNQDSNSRLYKIWDGMKSRCLFNHKTKIHYKEAGISLCSEWLEFSVFKKWALNNGYKDNLTIDRIDINKGYFPNNCEWVSRAENTRRQVRDYHGNQKAVSISIDNSEWVPFKSIANAIRYIIANKLPKHSINTIQAGLNNRLNGKLSTPYLGINIKYE